MMESPAIQGRKSVHNTELFSTVLRSFMGKVTLDEVSLDGLGWKGPSGSSHHERVAHSRFVFPAASAPLRSKTWSSGISK